MLGSVLPLQHKPKTDEKQLEKFRERWDSKKKRLVEKGETLPLQVEIKIQVPLYGSVSSSSKSIGDWEGEWGSNKAICNEYGTSYAISSDFGDQMTTQHLD